MINLEETILAQYANSPVLLALVQNMNACIDPSANLNNFYTQIRNVSTATGYGLDVWGRIVGVDRFLSLPPAVVPIFGFAGSGAQPFGQGTFTNGQSINTPYSLSDTDFRTLIYVKALANISDASIATINQILCNLFGTSARAYALDLGNMAIRYVFETILTPAQMALLQNSGAMAKPAGVAATLVSTVPAQTFGFNGSGLQPFGHGTFCPNPVPIA